MDPEQAHRGPLHPPWWRGTRGEWYVVAQFALMALVVAGPAEVAGRGRWPADVATQAIGLVLGAVGMVLFTASAKWLGPSLTPFPKPRRRGSLVQSGPYALVRHPIYTGVLAMALGYALWRASWFTLGYAALLFLFFDVKARREERWLRERYPDYAAYQRRVRRLVPWLY